MLKIGVFTYPLFGHVNYLSRLSKILQQQGHIVYIFPGKKYKELIENRKLTYCKYPESVELIFEETHIQMKNIEDENFIDNLFRFGDYLFNIVSLIDTHFAEIESYHFDTILYDSFAIWGSEIADRLNCKKVALITAHLINQKMIDLYPEAFLPNFFNCIDAPPISGQQLRRSLHLIDQQLQRIYPKCKKLSILSESSDTGDKNFIVGMPELQLYPEMIDKGNAMFIKPVFDQDSLPPKSHFISEHYKNIYISLGTLDKSSSHFWEVCISFFCHYDANVIISTCGESIEFSTHSPNIHIKDFVNQLAVLPYCDVFITHGGTNSFHESVYFGIPMIVIPQRGDQYINAKVIEQLGIGLLIEKKEWSQRSLRDCLQQILENTTYKNRCFLLSKEYQKYPHIDIMIRKIVELNEIKQ